MKTKLFIIINGKGGCGKDTLVEAFMKEHENTINLSAITPIKQIAEWCGYKETEKTDKARKFLADLKTVLVEWNNLPTVYLKQK